MEKEIRQFNIEFKSVPESPAIEGRAIPFNIASPNREGFRELILPEAVEGVIEKSDIFLLYNHDKSQGFLARNKKGKGSLQIDVREDGVYFSFVPADDNLSTYVKDRIMRGELDETSWAFTIEKDTWVKGSDGVWDRTINKFERLYDFSIVDQSYYGLENVVGCKRFQEIQEEERLENEARIAEEERIAEEKREQEEKEKQEKLKDYYNQLRSEYEAALKKGEEMSKVD